MFCAPSRSRGRSTSYTIKGYSVVGRASRQLPLAEPAAVACRMGRGRVCDGTKAKILRKQDRIPLNRSTALDCFRLEINDVAGYNNILINSGFFLGIENDQKYIFR